MFDLKTALAMLPDAPGVYLMHDASDKIIYVGKAKILKNRVRQYFHSSANHTPKVRAMVEHIAYFEYIVTDSEKEALVLECNLIKKYRPKYNILLKDDKQYPYIKVTMAQDYPRIMMTRRPEHDGARYFGPYMGKDTIKNTLDVIQHIFRPPMCSRRFPEDIGKGRPCLNNHIKLCFAPCMGKTTQTEYKRVFEEICAFLDSDHKQITAQLRAEMAEASAAMDFERAAQLRDRIFSIERLDEKQKIVKAESTSNRDVIAVCEMDEYAFFSVFFIRDGKVIGRESYTVEHVYGDNGIELMTDFVKQFYSDNDRIPEEIVLEYEVYDREAIEGWLRELCGHRVLVTVPQRGEKLRLVDMARKNARVACDNFRAEEIRRGKNRVLEELKDTLGLENQPRRIESYDISNISGTDSVAAMIVFEDGKPAKKRYRHFKIKFVEGSDDYASTQEVIYRRLTHGLDEKKRIEKGEMVYADAKFLPLPDLILADGGKGHVSAMREIIEGLELDIAVFGMVKDSRHRTRGLVGENGEIELSPSGGVFNFITRVQDEVHRFAITYFRKLHSKKSFRSELDDIKGVGEARRNALLAGFGSVDKIRKANIEELCAFVDKRTARNIYDYFNKTEEAAPDVH